MSEYLIICKVEHWNVCIGKHDVVCYHGVRHISLYEGAGLVRFLDGLD